MSDASLRMTRAFAEAPVVAPALQQCLCNEHRWGARVLLGCGTTVTAEFSADQSADKLPVHMRAVPPEWAVMLGSTSGGRLLVWRCGQLPVVATVGQTSAQELDKLLRLTTVVFVPDNQGGVTTVTKRPGGFRGLATREGLQPRPWSICRAQIVTADRLHRTYGLRVLRELYHKHTPPPA